jgi:hypothetical protein
MSSKSGQPIINVVQVWGNRVGVGIFIEYFVLFVASQLAQCPDEGVHAIWRRPFFLTRQCRRDEP